MQHAAATPTGVRDRRVVIVLSEAGIIAAVASNDGAILAAVIAGGFTLVNTLLTLWITSRNRNRDRDRKRRRKQRGEE